MTPAKVVRIGPGSLRDVKRIIAAQPRTLAFSIAKRVAPRITEMAQASYDAGQTVYGDAREDGRHGPLSLVKTGATRRMMKFVAAGSLVYCFLGTRYAKYLVGKYKILPIGDRTAIPVAWDREIKRIIEAEIAQYARRAS